MLNYHFVIRFFPWLILSATVTVFPVTVTIRLEDEISRASDYHRSGAFKVVKNILNDYYRLAALKYGQVPQMDAAAISRSLPQFDDGTELSKNRAIIGELFENDLVLTIEQAQDLLRGFGGRRWKRKLVDGTNYRWKEKTISYRIKDSNADLRRAAQTGIREWQENTCLNFQENGQGKDYIMFIKGSGCYSSVGRTGGMQEISIGQGCEKVGIVAHEIGHALGFWHEQSRPDRDAYIDIQNQNIIVGTQGNFERRSKINTYNVPYDLGSALHYSSKAFVTSYSLKSIETKDTNYQNTIGQRRSLSFIDIKQVNMAYCSNVCSPLSCRHGGYADPRNCRKCKCPTGLDGSYCERAAQSDQGCGRDVAATSQWQDLRASYSTNRNCYWLIRAPAGSRVILDITSVGMPCRDTCDSFLEVKFNRDFQQTGPRFCCEKPRATILSETEEMVVIFKTDHTSGNYGGVQARFRTDGVEVVPPAPPPPPQPIPTRPPPRPQPTFPPPTRPPPPSGGWGAWTSWSACSRTCGGCGYRTRRRSCSGRCNGESLERDECGEQVCNNPSRSKQEKCKLTVRIPCDILRYLRGHFDPTDPQYHIDGLPAGFHEHDAELETISSPRRSFGWNSRRNRMCTKTLLYHCPNGDRKFRSNNFDSCCPGYSVDKTRSVCTRRFTRRSSSSSNNSSFPFKNSRYRHHYAQWSSSGQRRSG